MVELNNLKGKTLIITPPDLKEKLLKGQKGLYDYKIMSLEEVRDNLFGYTDRRALVYLALQGRSVDLARIYLSYLPYVNSQDGNSWKIRQLIELKNELINAGVYFYNPLFTYYLKTVKVIISGYPMSKTLQLIMSKITETTDVELIRDKVESQNYPNVCEFKTIYDEVEFVTYEIAKLINDGININNIKIIGANHEYDSIFHRMFGFYKIPYNDNHGSTLFDTEIVQKFLQLIDTETIENALDIIRVDANDDIIGRIINVLNHYAFYAKNKNEIRACLIDEFKHTMNAKVIYENAVEFVDLEYKSTDDDHVFIINFTSESMPKIYHDIGYLNDSELAFLGLDTSINLCQIAEAKTLAVLGGNGHKYASYKLKSASGDSYPSELIKSLELTAIKDYKIPNTISFSMKYLEYKYGEDLDYQIQTGIASENLDVYRSNLPLLFKSFRNEFKGINPDDYLSSLKKPMTISYSALDNFFKCGFRYFLSNIMGLDTFDNELGKNRGTLFHYMLEHYEDEEFDYDQAFTSCLQEMYPEGKSPSEKDFFFLNAIKPEVLLLIEYNKKITEATRLKNVLKEFKVEIPMQYSIPIVFKGFIDRVIYDDNKSTIALIDYKTYAPKFNLGNLYYGINMQLPIYAYLMEHSKDFKNSEIAGMYLQRVMTNLSMKNDVTLNDYNFVKYSGYSNSSVVTMSKLNPNYKDYSFVAHIGKNEQYWKDTLSTDEINVMKQFVGQKIDEGIKGILNQEFMVNPKTQEGELIGCEFCEFNDICFLNERNKVELAPKDYKEFLTKGDGTNGVE